MTVLHVAFRVGSAEYVLPASDVLQMESFNGATPVPGAPSYVAGLVQIRGRVVPVIDLRSRFGLPPVERTLDTRVIVSQVGERVVGLVVDTGREVLKLSPEQFKPPPEVITAGSHGLVRAIAQVGSRIVLLLDVGRIVGEELGHGE